MALGVLGIIGSILGGIGGIASTVSAIKGASEQSRLSRETFDYQKELQERIFEREDNAVQRRALDLEKAGLSKTLAAGSGANAGQAVKVDTPLSESALRGQALSQGIQNMLSIAQAKANIALTEANAKKTEAEAKTAEFDYDWYKDAGIPSGTHSGLSFLTNSIANMFGITNQQASSVLRSALVKLAEKFGIDVSSLLDASKSGPPELYKEVVIDLSNLKKESSYKESSYQGNYSFGFLNQEESLANELERKLEHSESFMNVVSRSLKEYRYLSAQRNFHQYGMFLRRKRGVPFAGDGYGGGMLNVW